MNVLGVGRSADRLAITSETLESREGLVMNYDMALDFGQRIMAREKKAGKSDAVVRDRIYNAVICMACDDDRITAKAVKLARRVVAALIPGEVQAAAVMAEIEPINK